LRLLHFANGTQSQIGLICEYKTDFVYVHQMSGKTVCSRYIFFSLKQLVSMRTIEGDGFSGGGAGKKKGDCIL
jgi:hypothetical protein